MPPLYYSSVWQWLKGVLVAAAIAATLVAILMRWLDYVHRCQYQTNQGQRRKEHQMRSLLGLGSRTDGVEGDGIGESNRNNGGDDDDDDDIIDDDEVTINLDVMEQRELASP